MTDEQGEAPGVSRGPRAPAAAEEAPSCRWEWAVHGHEDAEVFCAGALQVVPAAALQAVARAGRVPLERAAPGWVQARVWAVRAASA